MLLKYSFDTFAVLGLKDSNNFRTLKISVICLLFLLVGTNHAYSQTITTGTITPLTFCVGGSFSVPYTIIGTYTGNTFTAQLSNSSGSFASPTNIGTLVSNSNGTITASLPTNTIAGNGYRIRVVSSNPAVTGTVNEQNLTFPSFSNQNQADAGTNSWIAHVYDGTNAAVAYNGDFTNYYGRYTETETFDQNFGAAATCFSINSESGTKSIYTETFSIRYRMNSTKKGLYVVDLGSDDGGRLTVDGTLLYNEWNDHSFNSRPRVLINLTGNSVLTYDFYENGGNNRVTFNNLTLILANNLTTNTTQTICLGSTGVAISGDLYGTLPTGITLNGTGYQWAYSTTSGGALIDISGATAATFTPNTATAPFNTTGTYFLKRKASVTSVNNTGVSNFTSTNTSNEVTVIIDSTIGNNTISSTQTICSGSTPAALTGTTPTGGSGTYTYLWESSTTSAVAGFATVSGTSTASAYSPGALTQTTWYRRKVSSGGCSIVSAAIQITVDPVSVLGTVSNVGPIDFSSATGDWSSKAISVSGAVGTITWEWGNSNNYWSSLNSGSVSPLYTTFPKMTTTAVNDIADRIRWRVKSGACSVTAWSSTILLRNHFNEAPTSLTSSASSIITGTAITLTATFPSNINIYGKVEFSTNSNGSSPFSSITAGNNSSTVSVLVTPPVGTTTYYVRYVPGAASGGAATASVAVTVQAFPTAPTTTGAQICVGSPSTTLSASDAVSGQVYKWYSASTGGTLLKTSLSHTDNTFVTPALTATTSYWVAIQSSASFEGARAQVTATYPSFSAQNQYSAGTNSWIGHVYDGTNAAVAFDGNFTNYYGHYTEAETFDQNFGGNTTCFSINSETGTKSIYTETFSVRYRMNSTKKGLYVVDLGSDDGGRLTVDGTLLFNNWLLQSFSSRPRVLINLTGSSALTYDFYENEIHNRLTFSNLTLVLANVLNTNTSQSISLGNEGVTISGDAFGTLGSGTTEGLSNGKYQWAYSTTSGGALINIAGATAATFTPNTSTAPFNAEGVYYVVRRASVTSANNTGVTNYTPTNTSNEAIITITVSQNAYKGGNGDGYHNATVLNHKIYADNIYVGGAGRGDIMAQHVNLWSGNVSTAWAIAANWTGGYVPFTSDAIEFANVSNFGSVASNDLVLDGVRTIGDMYNVTNKKLIVAPTTSLIVKGSINTENNKDRILIQANSTQASGTFIFPQSQTAYANVQFYSKAITPNEVTNSGDFVWQYMGIPVKSFTPNTLHGWYMRQHLEEYTGNKWWHPVTNATVLTSFKGYEISRKLSTSPTGIATFFGELENRDRDIPLTVTNTASIFKGQHVVSNPYTAAISIGAGLEFATGIDATVHLYHTGSSNEWDTRGNSVGEARGQYLSVPRAQAGSNGLPSKIAAMQGFVVKATTHNAILRFRYAGIDTENTVKRAKQVESNKVSILIKLIKADSVADKAWVFAEENKTTNDFDNGWDSRKLLTNNSDAYIHTQEGMEKLQVNSRPDIDNTLIAFKAEKGIISYKLSFTHLNIDKRYEKVLLIDLKEKKSIDISNNESEYEFFADNTVDAERRFLIKTNSPDNENEDNVFVSRYGGSYVITNMSNKATDVVIYDAAGKIHSKYRIAAFGIELLNSKVPAGLYLFNFTGEGFSETKKIILH